MNDRESGSPSFDLQTYEREVASRSVPEVELDSLAKGVRIDDPTDRQRLIQAALWIPLKIAKEYGDRFPGWSIGDVIEEANIGLFMAAEDLPKRGDQDVSHYISKRVKMYLDSLKQA